MKFYTVSHPSANQSLTPEGFLVAHNVPIGRTGSMLYVAGEVPVEAGRDGLIKIERSPEDVFNENTIASFQCKPVTLDHPTEDVNPANWANLAKGVVQNVRRGEGIEDDVMLADLLITDAEAIQSIRAGLREVSAGYDADYEQIEPGRGMQRHIIGNHVALVEKGRCGSRCAIGDKDMADTSKKKTRWSDFKGRITAAFKARDEAELSELLAEEPEPDDPTKGAANEETPGDGVDWDRFSTRLDALEARINGLTSTSINDARSRGKDEETEEEKRKRKQREDEEEDDRRRRARSDDSMPSLAQIQETYARAEILFPGIKLPTFDAAATPARVRDSLCALRRQALARAYENESGRAAIVPFVGSDPNFTAMTCDSVSTVFVGASEIVKRENNYEATVSRDSIARSKQTHSTIAEINKRNSEYWNRS